MKSVLLQDLATVIRSKNSGPFEITFDVIFEQISTYEKVKQSGSITPEIICVRFSVVKSDIVTFMFFDPAMAFKLTLKRPWKQGSSGERDTFGAQQHAPLMDIPIQVSE